MNLIIIRDKDDYVICKNSRAYKMFVARRKRGRQLDIMNLKRELLLRANKKRKNWFGPEPAIQYTIKASNRDICEVRWKDTCWEMSDGKTIYDLYTFANNAQTMHRNKSVVAEISREITFFDDDIIYISMDEEEDPLQIIGFVLLFTIERNYSK